MRIFSRRPSADPDRLRRGWYDREAVASAYDERRFSSLRGRMHHRREVREILRALDRLPADAAILDVPCGTGRILDVLVRRGSAIGCDASPAMLAIAGARSAAALVRARLPDLPFRDRTFDAALCIRFLMHVRGPDRIRALSELARVSRGLVIADLRHRRSIRYLLRALRVRLGVRRYGKLRLSEREIRETFSRAGLRILAIRYFWPWLSEECIVVAEPDGRRGG
ncbi:MAG: class I SAM-dependent methyltransferase [Planctomycetes bacterium]|nr:class I SAM-dependent methyltransferase [Planctomycetota bacterium]